ncbi:E3 ubiquitin-protein ligase SINA-like 10-like protein [Drosera capensis]
MVRFSIPNDGTVPDDDFHSAPKRKRTTSQPSLTTPQQNPCKEGMEVSREGEGDSSKAVVSLFLSDPDVLDCSICFDSLTVPVYQCENGHIACSSCCSKLKNRCPSCCRKLGPNRCRAIEKVIESVKVSCCYVNYGCKALINYCQRHEHEKICIYAPCSCPFSSCLFRGSASKLSHHICLHHSGSVVHFSFNCLFPVSAKWNNKDDKFILLQEEKNRVLFVMEKHEGTLNIKCMEVCPDKGSFTYDLIVRNKSSSLRFQSTTKCVEGQAGDLLTSDCLLLPFNFFVSDIIIELCIWSQYASCPDISDRIAVI